MATDTKKFGTQVFAVTARIIKDVGAGGGKVVQTVRDDRSGELLGTEVFDLDDVKNTGLPVPAQHVSR